MNEKIIYKWGPLNFGPFPIRGNVVHVGWQDGNVFIWAEEEIDPSIGPRYRTAKLHPTGQQYTGIHLGSVVAPSGLVWHVVEEDGP
jgi:hypothetical protein